MIKPTVINGAEVFDSEGTLALMVNGIDVLHLSLLTDDQGANLLTSREHQEVIDAICSALMIPDTKESNG